ncbi:hypothetical protein AWP46_22800 [Escherichia coli]|nr:hypothetical protein AWP46_22800 [Escherichia coli]
MNIRKLFCPGNTPRIILFLFFFVVSVITTIACGYTEKNATGNVLLLFLLLLLAHWICPYISRHLLSLNPLQARCRRYSRGER